MKTHLHILCLLASSLTTTVISKPHGKHQDSPKILEADPEQASEGKLLPTSITFLAESEEHEEDEDVSYDDSEGLPKEDGALEEKSTPVLLSEEALADLLEESEEEEQEEEEEEEEDEDDGPEEVPEEVETEGESEDEGDSSAESEIPADMDYAGDSDGLESQEPAEEEEAKPLTDSDSQLLPTGESQAAEEVPDSRDYESPEGVGAEEATGSLEEQEEKPITQREVLDEMAEGQEEDQKREEGQANDAQEAKESVELGEMPNTEGAATGGGEGEESNRNDSGAHPKGKARKQRKNQRAKKPSAPREAEEGQGPLQKGHMEKEPDTAENTVQNSKKRKIGKWATLVGMNPAQIRATEELYPNDQRPQDESVQGAPLNPCRNFRCKRGKTCEVNEENEPVCVCQDPSSCTPSATAIEHVCGTDNKTYDTSCELFATKCNLEGTKKAHRLHLDYTGSCKYIAPCLQGELLQFPLRMRDWLKNVLLQLYERETRNPGFLTPKQRARVQKIYESERRLHADDHPIELLIRDFEKNYNMYIYPVHWQFAQMDQHPADRFLSHSELAPLRVPLVPMEHCTSLFFKQCDADKDKQVSFREWGHCFGIKDEDLDLNLLF
ncbi:SPARC-like protein 1 [Conger conger]|uniref:SPARC-like protein 1 n=1 Tax=Conger conger TaxID=82655 RepID=UPI002A5A9A3A|nr:SPARC-like protein 1 [Conger conger]